MFLRLHKKITLLKKIFAQKQFFRDISDVQKKITSSYYFMHGDVLLSSSTIGQLVDEAANKYGDSIYCISAHEGVVKNFSDFRKEVKSLASGLISLGLKRGDRIAICSPNCYEWPVIQFAAAKAGLILVTINPAYQAEELEYSLKKVKCKSIITWDQLKTTNYYNVLCKIIPELPKCVPGKLKSKNCPDLESVIMISNQANDGTLTYNDLLNIGDSESDRLLGITENLVQFDDAANIQFTSGTTGSPKASVLSHHNMVNNALVAGRRVGYNLLTPRICCTVPLFHCYGCVMGSLSAMIFHGTLVFPSTVFSPKEALKAIENYKCSVLYGTPTMHMDVLKNYQAHKGNVNSLKKVLIGGSPCPEVLIKNTMQEYNLHDVHIIYGATENSFGTAISGLGDTENSMKGNLQPLEFVELKVVDEKNCLVPVNQQGELCVRGHLVFLKYWEDEAKTDEVLDQSKWYHTGDLCQMDEYGFIKIVGRKKDMVIRGGENLFPAEIENFLCKHPAILEVQVVGIPDARMGEELCAWIRLKEGGQLNEPELRNYCSGKISHFKVPKYMMFVDSFPKTESGKIKKYEIQRISKEKLNL